MKLLFSIKNRIEELYLRHPALCGYITRFIFVFAVLMILRSNIGFNPVLTSFIFVIVFSVICAFVPSKPLILFLMAYIVVQIFSLAPGTGIFACFLFVIMYLVYFRFSANSEYLMLLIPLMCIVRLPILIPLILAVTASAGSVICVMLGVITFYFIRYIHMYTAVFQGVAENDEVSKLSMVISGVFTYKEMWYSLGCMILVFFAVYYIKRININKSNEMAIAMGSGIYLISMLVCSLAFGNITTAKLTQTVIGTVVSCLLAVIISSVILPLDYNRTEHLEFEDEEYKYYVRAVPKSIISKESVRIKRIYSRRQTLSDNVKGDTK